MKELIFIDVEVGDKNYVVDYGAISANGKQYHGSSRNGFKDFISKADYLCGHNIINHDLKYIDNIILKENYKYIDTLFLSPLFYPKSKMHKLIKDDKINPESVNNPLNDSIKSRDLFYQELSEFEKMPKALKTIFGTLLYKTEEFSGFFNYVSWHKSWNLKKDIFAFFAGKICENCKIDYLIDNYNIELAYVLALLSVDDKHEIVSPWVQKNFNNIDYVINLLRGRTCGNCSYCNRKFDPVKRLEEIFGYKTFRTYGDKEEPLQEKAVRAAMNGDSILTIFPTGGGKSITFQLPALIAGEATKSLTVVISPLQSLMKNQVDGLESKNIIDAVSINGLLDPISRKEAIERVLYGGASLLYISPESLRSKTIENILLSRKIERIVIDEAHCFSAWGQDFRVDYLFIADFIKRLEMKKGENCKIPVSCFTATAKQKVISDIIDYFKERLNINLEKITTEATRKNLRYKVELIESEEKKYQALRDILNNYNCPTIVYASRTKDVERIASNLVKDGFSASFFHGKLDSQVKIENQDAFINDEVRIMVATSAFGMGVDKSDVKLVIHYDISDSLENYVQESGRAGRDQNINAECVIFYNENDLDKHFLLLNQTKLGMDDVQKVWKGIKILSGKRKIFSCSPLELARASGWDQEIDGIETTIKSAVNALEDAGYIQRGLNSPRVFATSINAKDVIEGRKRIISSNIFDEKQVEIAVRILSHMMGKKYRSRSNEEDAESRVDYIADILGLDKNTVIDAINKMRQIRLLKDDNDMTAIMKDEQTKVQNELERFASLERFLFKSIIEEHSIQDLKQLNDAALKDGVKRATVKNIRTILLYWTINKYINRTTRTSDMEYEIKFNISKNILESKLEKRLDLANFIIEHFYSIGKKDEYVSFSIVQLIDAYNNRHSLFSQNENCTYEEMQSAIIYLTKINAISIEGGFLVLYNAMQIERKEMDNKVKYKLEDYKHLKEHYELKVAQIHMVGQYANMMVNNYEEAMTYVKDYFELEYDAFVRKYFKVKDEIKRNITKTKYNQVLGELSEIQKKIVLDEKNKYITVLAGPGSGKTKLLVHKLASLLILEGIKTEQLLMLTFSRAAATEFKERLLKLINNTAYYVDVKTFHSFCFDLLGKLGDETLFDEVVVNATEMIENNEVETSKITKSVLVIDEAQDMDEDDYNLIKSLINYNQDMKVILVGDDDQNIYEFRKSNSEYMQRLTENKEHAMQYELVENYRSVKKVVDFSNRFVSLISNRMKTKPITHVKKENGNVKVIRHNSVNMEIPLVNHLKQNGIGNKKIGILTQTNEQALNVLTLLTQNNISCKLIQSDKSITLFNIKEIRYFIELIKSTSSPIITNEEWMNAKNALVNLYSESTMLDLVNLLLERFNKTNKTKYKNDLISFIKESQIEDFVDCDNANVVVSTIHKSKGHEFDSVYMLLKDPLLGNNKEKRVYYVGMTRAKENLYIHCNNDIFYKFKNYCEYYYDNTLYDEVDEIIIELTHRDVRLGNFINKRIKNLVDGLRSGEGLKIENDVIYTSSNQKICHFSNNFNSNILASFLAKGYEVTDAKIRNIVYWFDKENVESKEEWLIVLPTIYMKKRSVGTEKLDDIFIDVNGTYIEESKENIKISYDERLYKKLRQLRMRVAIEKNVRAFIIFNDKTLMEICEKLPQTKEDFLRINGVGEAKFAEFGDRFIGCIKKYINEKIK